MNDLVLLTEHKEKEDKRRPGKVIDACSVFTRTESSDVSIEPMRKELTLMFVVLLLLRPDVYIGIT